jgi:uncharacterized protein
MDIAAFIGTVFVASLVGSLHCAGMCGAFVALAVGVDEKKPVSRARLHAAYNGGRFVTYTALGVLAGTIGRAADMGGSALGLPRIAAYFAAGAMILMGLVMLLRLVGVRTPRARAPKPIQAIVVKGHRAAMRFSPTVRALIIGLMTTLLPCGWLYSFAMIAMGTASPLLGGLTMAIFWAGTLPVLLSIGALVRTLSGRFGPGVQAAMAIVIVAAGVWTAFRRVNVDLSTHQHAMHNASLEQLMDEARSLNPEDAACCSPEPKKLEDPTPQPIAETTGG